MGTATLVTGCAGAGSKAGKGSDQEEEAAWESRGEEGTEGAGCMYTCLAMPCVSSVPSVLSS